MPIVLMLRPGGGGNPLSILAAFLIVGGGFFVLQDRLRPPDESGLACDPVRDPECVDPQQRFDPLQRTPAGPVVGANEVCPSAGYLCDELEITERIRVERWKDDSGTIVVHVPMPDIRDRAGARDLRTGAVRGIRLWNGQPFPITVVEREDGRAHFSVRWAQGMGGSQIGVARTEWSPATGRRVVSLELATHDPFTGRIIEGEQVRLTAAHEMGHALGLPHSASPRDVMYPTNRATSLSRQDYRTLQALYELPDGTEIVR